MNPDRRILIIDDDSDFLAAMCMQFRGRYGVMTAKSISEALILLEKSDVDLILLDVGLEGEDGLDGIKKIHAVHPLMSIAMLSGMRDVKTVVQAQNQGVSKRGVLLEARRIGAHENARRLDYEQAISQHKGLNRALAGK